MAIRFRLEGFGTKISLSGIHGLFDEACFQDLTPEWYANKPKWQVAFS